MTHALKFAQLATAFLVETAIDDDELFSDGFEDGNPDAWTIGPP